jgi:hypothetical protein
VDVIDPQQPREARLRSYSGRGLRVVAMSSEMDFWSSVIPAASSCCPQEPHAWPSQRVYRARLLPLGSGHSRQSDWTGFPFLTFRLTAQARCTLSLRLRIGIDATDEAHLPPWQKSRKKCANSRSKLKPGSLFSVEIGTWLHNCWQDPEWRGRLYQKGENIWVNPKIPRAKSRG